MGGDPMKRALVIPVAAAAIVWGTAVAHADPASNNDQYDQFLISHGVEGDLLQLGYAQCAGLRAGSSEQVLIGRLERQIGSVQADDIVVAAHR